MANSLNSDISATELEMKRRGRRRLIGAITIGLLAVVFLPMIFDSEPKRSGQAGKTQDISVQVPPKEGQPPLPPPSATPSPAPAPAVIEVPKAVTPPPTSVVTAGTAETSPAAMENQKSPTKSGKAEKAEKAEKTAKPEMATTPAKSGFVVQLGVFADADNAKQVIAKMKEAKLAVYTETIPIKTGDATRVRVGPFPTRDQADAALANVKLAGADGKIVPLQSPGR